MKDFNSKKLGSEPISTEYPAGNDISFEIEFEWLEKEYGKLSKPTLKRSSDDEGSDQHGDSFNLIYEDVNWHKIVDIIVDILQGKSKDLRIAAYLVWGLLEIEKVDGLLRGLTVYRDIVFNFWNDLFPPIKRLTARIACAEMFCSHLKKRISASDDSRIPIERSDKSSIVKSVKILEELNRYFKTNANTDSEIFRGLSNILTKRLEESRKKKKTEISEYGSDRLEVNQTETTQTDLANQQPSLTKSHKIESSSPTIQNSDVDIPAPAEFNTPKDVADYFIGLRHSGGKLSSYGLQGLTTDPVPYRWLRVVQWINVKINDKLEYLNDMGPHEMQLEQLENLYLSAQWDKLLRLSEELFAQRWAWLDTQRYSCEALQQLGPDYIEAREAILKEVIFFLRSSPHLVKLKYRSGVHVANMETQKWLKALLSNQSEFDGDNPDLSNNHSFEKDSGHTQDVFSASADLKQNIETAESLLNKSLGERQAYLIRLNLAECLLKQNRFILAYSYLDTLDNINKAHDLEAWEPDLVVKSLELLYRCTDQMKKVWKEQRLSLVNKNQDILARLAVLDPKLAMEIIDAQQ
jgi:type VI secretion system protein VasJ